MKVSIIIPVHNAREHIGRCLESILSQSFRDFEILVINDATPDDSMEIVSQYAQRDPRIRMFHNERNRGAMVTRRVGYENATGDYIMFVDSDDFLPPNAINALVTEALASNADLVCGNAEQTTSEGSVKKFYSFSKSAALDTEGVCRALLMFEMQIVLWAKLYSRRLFDYEYDTFENRNHATDVVLFSQIAQHVKKATFIDDVVYCYVENKESVSFQQSMSRVRQRALGMKYIEKIGEAYPHLRLRAKTWIQVDFRISMGWGLQNAEVLGILKELGMQQYLTTECFTFAEKIHYWWWQVKGATKRSLMQMLEKVRRKTKKP